MNHDAVAQRLQSGQFEVLRVIWCDNANVIRGKTVFLPPLLASVRDVEKGLSLIKQLDETVGITAALQSVPATHDEPAADAKLAPVKDVRLVPDWDSFASCPTTASVATVIGDMIDGDQPWSYCPREYLRRMEREAFELEIVVEAGIELEFFLLRPSEDPDAFSRPGRPNIVCFDGLGSNKRCGHRRHPACVVGAGRSR